jgi:Icc-related predicted phosphoesterase
MKWLFLSDLQGVMYQDWLNFKQMDHRDWDVIVTLGDIDTLILKSIAERFQGKPIIGLIGNHDFKGDLEYYGIQNLHQNPVILNGKKVAGIEGCIKYKNEKDAPLYTQEEVGKMYRELESCDIIISHNSPFGIHDKAGIAHEGYIGLKQYIEEHQPTHVFHGHQHTHQVSKYKSTKIVGIYGGWIWNQEDDTFTKVLNVVD